MIQSLWLYLPRKIPYHISKSKNGTNLFWRLLILLGLFVFCTACTAPLPQRSTDNVLMLDIPSTPIEESIYFDDKQSFHTVTWLANSLGRWYGMQLLQFPADSSPVQLWTSMFAGGSKAEGLTISEEQLLAVKSESEAEQIVSDVIVEIEQTYGNGARADFEIELYFNAAVALHEGYYTLFQQDKAERYLLFQGADFLEYVAALLEARNAEQKTITELRNIETVLRAMPASYEELNLISEQLGDLESPVNYAMRGLPTPVPTPTLANPLGTDITKRLPTGDPTRGAELNVSMACSACHPINTGVAVAPPWKDQGYADNKGIGVRAQERWQADDYSGSATSAAEYLFESTVLPAEDVVEGYIGGVMPQTYGKTLSEQDMADLIAFLLEIE